MFLELKIYLYLGLFLTLSGIIDFNSVSSIYDIISGYLSNIFSNFSLQFVYI